MTGTATTPFVFTCCVELRQTLNLRALDERELLDRMEEAPEAAILFHTYGYFLRHGPMTMAYGNDFASWVATQLRDHVLAERLAVVNPFEFDSLGTLREELLTVINDHLLRLSSVPRIEFGEPFYFQQSDVVQVPLGAGVSSLAEFQSALADVDTSALYFHMIEARARLGRRADDFSEWIRTGLGLHDLADRIARIDAYMTSLERVRARVLGLVEQALEAEGA